MTTILLLRHGETAYVASGRLSGRMPGVPLNDKGRQEAARIAEALRDAPIKAIYSSPIQRAVETAEPLAQALGLPVQIREGLIETHAGDWSGRTLKQVTRFKLWKVCQEQPSQFQFPGGETFVDTQQRIVQELDALAKEHDEKDIIACFSHGDPIKLAIAYYLSMPLDSFQRVGIDTGSMTILRLGNSRPHLGPINHMFNLEWPRPKA